MSKGTLTYAEVSAGVQATLATYTQSLDSGRFDDVLATFIADGVLEIPDFDLVAEGHDALRAYYVSTDGKGALRHVVANSLVSEQQDGKVDVSSDLLVLRKGDTGWALLMVGTYRDTLRLDEGVWRFQRRTLSFSN
ncbi:nuclear transport factor 2 family protein [Rhodococcus sp. NPDC003318]|uniref:nuclear transport factor 2 family protein n=1 Tax=Rhodococcus sp. NPDC003318 TaxID=3364503 RepID=UPI0036B39A97